MSRVGKEPISLPETVEVTMAEGELTVKGPKGTLTQDIDQRIAVDIANGVLTVTRTDDEQASRALHGLYRALIANMVHGVTEGFQRTLEIVGVGYRATARDQGLTVQVGYSHPVHVDPPEGIALSVPSSTRITVSGADKQLVGQVAADIRAIRRPEPYKGKGIRYEGEAVRRKAGKAAGV